MARRKRRKKKSDNKRKVIGAALFLLALVLLISLVSHRQLDDDRISGQVDGHLNPFEMAYQNQAGLVGAFLAFALTLLLGWLAYFIPVGLGLLSLRRLAPSFAERLQLHTLLLAFAALMGTTVFNVHFLVANNIGFETDAIGGWLGISLTQLMVKLVGELGSYVVAGGLVLLLLMTYTSITPLLSMKIRLPGGGFFRKMYQIIMRSIRYVVAFRWISSSNDDDSVEEYEEAEYEGDGELEEYEPETDEYEADEPESEPQARPRTPRKRATLKRSPESVRIKSVNYTGPGLDLLDSNPNIEPPISADELEMTARMLEETLETFQVSIQGKIEQYPGPVITRFEFKPGTGVKVNRIISLADDLALALKAKRIRIVAPIPGKAAVGVEIPNHNPQTVYLREVLNSEAYNNPKLILPVAFGKTISGKPYVTDLAKMPHLLIAGSTGSGKSVCMNTLITSLIYRLHPLKLRLVFIDPKMLELSVYSGIPHLARPVVTSPKRAERVLSDIVVEMEKRYRRLAEASVRNIEDYNARQKTAEEKLPYIVVFVDELADLMMSSTSSKVEALITRLAQMARAVGIHLILATQRPSVDVITGLIKANFPARVAFQVASKVDSRTIIDANGAEKLLGAGDMLYLPSGTPEPIRLHGAFVSSDETDRLVTFIKDQGLEMLSLDTISQEVGEVTAAEVDLGDPLFREACEVVIRHKQGSVSLLQRRLGIGYQRAARLIDKLEQAGVVSPFDGSKAREVMVDQSYMTKVFGAAPVPTAETPE